MTTKKRHFFAGGLSYPHFFNTYSFKSFAFQIRIHVLFYTIIICIASNKKLKELKQNSFNCVITNNEFMKTTHGKAPFL